MKALMKENCILHWLKSDVIRMGTGPPKNLFTNVYIIITENRKKERKDRVPFQRRTGSMELLNNIAILCDKSIRSFF